MNNITINDASTIEIERLPSISMSTAIATKGFWPRAASYFVDEVISFQFFLLAGINAGLILGMMDIVFGTQITQFEAAPLLDTAVGLGFFVIYYSIFEWLFGATPGKALLRMRVVGINGNRASAGSSFVRGTARLIDGLFFGLVAAINMQGTLKQRWGDKLAKTIVVSASDPVIRVRRSWWWFLAAFGLNWLATSCLLIAAYTIAYLLG